MSGASSVAGVERPQSIMCRLRLDSVSCRGVSCLVRVGASCSSLRSSVRAAPDAGAGARGSTRASAFVLAALVIVRSRRGSATLPSPTCSARSSAAPSGSASRRRSARAPVLGRQRRSPRRLPAQRRPARPAVPRARASAARHGEWLEPATPAAACSASTAPQRHYRSSTPASSSTAASPTSARPASSTARWSIPQFVLKELQLRRRLRRLAQAQSRPARARHPAEDPEDVGRRGHRFPTSTSRRCARSISS